VGPGLAVVAMAARGSGILYTRLEPRANAALNLIYHQILKVEFRYYFFDTEKHGLIDYDFYVCF